MTSISFAEPEKGLPNVYFLRYPSPEQLEKYTHLITDSPCKTGSGVFVSGVPPQQSLEVVAWVIDTLLNKPSCLSVTKGRKQGCCKIKLTDPYGAKKLVEYTRSVLFGSTGICHAVVLSKADADARREQIDAYCTQIREGKIRVNYLTTSTKALAIELLST